MKLTRQVSSPPPIKEKELERNEREKKIIPRSNKKERRKLKKSRRNIYLFCKY